LWDFSEQLDRLVTAGDITAVPLLLDRRMFDSKTFNDDTRSSQAVNVLTIISKFAASWRKLTKQWNQALSIDVDPATP
jgi:hypothetical protein